jgi:class 3 adenylate cyclase
LTPGVERRKLVTSVFCDLSGSTALAERVDTESVFELMRSYYETARGALERHGGAVEKFIGDAVVGMFGVPEANEDDALRACRAALEIQEQFTSGEITVRIGINTGEVVAGDAARREMFASGDSVVLGDSVNVAARLEQAAAPGEVLIGEATYQLVRDAVLVEPVAPVAAKGKSEPVIAYRLLEVRGTGRPRRSSSRALIGRQAELAFLEGELEQVMTGGCRLVTVLGEPGMGKSRLAAELLGGAGSEIRATAGACPSYGEGMSFWAIGQIVRDLAGIRDDESADEARERVPLRLAQMLGLAEGAATADQTAQAIARFLAGAAAERPLVVVVDDLHWAEPALLDLVVALPGLIGEAKVLLLCLARHELLDVRPEWPVSVRLDPLGAADVETLLDGLGAPAATRVRIALAAAGNPLYAEELVAWAGEGGDLDEMPTSLNALIGARLDRLGARERDALERGAIEGELFHQGAVVELTDIDARPAVRGELDQLTRKDLIRLTAASFVGELVAYRFKHILVREAAYRATTKRLRAALHERYADWLVERAGERVGEYNEVVGYHLEQAYRYRAELGDTDSELAARAATYLAAAGRHANDTGDVRGAANLLGRAAALLPADSLERLELLFPYVYALGESGRMIEYEAVNEGLLQQATATGHRRLAAQASLRTHSDGRALTTADDFIARRAAIQTLIPTFVELNDEVDLAVAKRRLGTVCRGLGQAGEGTPLLEEALVHANAGGDLPTRRIVTQSLAMMLFAGPVPVAEATARCRELRDGVDDDRVLDAVITRCLSAFAAMEGDFELASAYWRSADSVLNEVNMMVSSSVSRGITADARAFTGDRDGAIRELETRWLAFRDTYGGAPDQHALQAAYRLAHLYCDDGRWSDAQECVEYHAEIPWTGNYFTAIYYRLSAAARLEAHRGELGKALELGQQAVEIVERCDFSNERALVWLALAEVRSVAGQPDAAHAAAAAALELYEAKGNVAAANGIRATVLS